jgi:N-acetylmuramoyl-L-alanine amidase
VAKKPSKQPGKTRTAEVQRSSVKRAQQASRRNTRAQASRISSLADESNKSSESPTVAVSLNTRRGIVWGVIGLAAALLLVTAFQNRASWLAAAWPGPTGAPSAMQTAEPGANPISTLPSQNMANGDWQNRVGIVSGHRGNDSGTVCDDGLTEAQVNFDAATRAASILRAQGYTVDVLNEFDARLTGYRARAMLSIHADSCIYINELATGYKVARFLYSAIPEEEDKLVACLSARYKTATGLPFHRTSVTHDMKQYHAFREIDPKTPGAIIELGFMYKDRNVLVRRKDDVAQGVANGLLCFLRGESL